ncbi:hemolysin III family protein [Mycobacterium sp.]|uniref:PAQR family membrane homeostasis protein TrhA n=1 Tax=Mycobacterium sp. TaxID=1785 RepID=UPI0025E75FBB|nr:hemolysin III family protein [Mycobacterium sp.]MBW0015322.1 hemolysin III family protein [Mycobacterium sp.]
MSSHTSTVTHAESGSHGPAASAAQHVVDGVARVLTKPRFRGWIHVYSAGAAVAAGASLIAVSWAVSSARAGLATFAYTAATVVMFTVSATYHRVNWKSETARKWMKRLDHSMIFVFIAGSYTPFALLAMPPHAERVVLSIVWGGALAGVLLKVCWPSAPRWLGVPLYLLLGWVAVWYTGTILHNAGVTAMVLLFVGGVLYSVGGILYALKWPNPWPSTFGFHEFFHACTAVAAICHYIAMWFVVF